MLSSLRLRAQPLRLDIKRQLSARSDRVKNIDLHPTEPWMLVALYVGQLHVWNYETNTIIKVSFGFVCRGAQV